MKNIIEEFLESEETIKQTEYDPMFMKKRLLADIVWPNSNVDHDLYHRSVYNLAPRMANALKIFIDSKEFLCRCEQGGYTAVAKICPYCAIIERVQSIMEGKE